tara:strand:- start:50 stop:844 length:795 start_codon:yes stop_codon:yes gene_type:complete
MSKFIAAMDHSGGSTGGVLDRYQVPWNEHNKMETVHAMRLRMVNSVGFNSDNIWGAILYQDTVERGMVPILRKKGITPFLKVDNGCEENGTLKPFSVTAMCSYARANRIVGTKMRSIITELDLIETVVAQQFKLAQAIAHEGLIPIIEPEIPIDHPWKAAMEKVLVIKLATHLSTFEKKVILKLTLPEKTDQYGSLLMYNNVAKIVGLSGGYSTAEACKRLSNHKSMSASFSRALSEGLFADQSKGEFDAKLLKNISMIKEASS